MHVGFMCAPQRRQVPIFWTSGNCGKSLRDFDATHGGICVASVSLPRLGLDDVLPLLQGLGELLVCWKPIVPLSCSDSDAIALDFEYISLQRSLMLPGELALVQEKVDPNLLFRA